MISWQASVAGDGKRVAAVCFGGCFQHFTASPTSSPTSSSSSSSSSLPSFSSSSPFTSSANSAVANLVTDSYDFTLSGQYCRRQGRRTTVPVTCTPNPTTATTLTATPGPLMVVPEENASWRSDGRHTSPCGGGRSSVGGGVGNSGGVDGVVGLPRQHEVSPFVTGQVDPPLQHQPQQTNSHPFQENSSFESFSSSTGCCAPSRSGTVVGADSSTPQQQSGADFQQEKDRLFSTSSSLSFPQWLGRRCTTSGEVRYPLQHQTSSTSHPQPVQSSCLAASAASASPSSAAAVCGGKDSVVPMVALECELPRSGRLSPHGADVAFTFLPAVVSSSSSPSSSSSIGRIGEDSATTTSSSAAAAVTDSMYCPGTMLPPPMPSLRSAVSSSSDSNSSSCTATGSESGGIEGQSLSCPSVVSSSPFSQTVSSTNSSSSSSSSSSSGTSACLSGNSALVAAADSPHSQVTLAASPCLQAPSGSNLGDEERHPIQCPVAMSASPLLQTFCSSSNTSDINDLSALQQQHQHRCLLESPQHVLSSSSCSSSSTSSACSSRAGCKRRFSLHLREGEEEADGDCNRVRVNGLDVEDMLNVDSASSAVTCGRCGEECGGGAGEEGNPSKRRKLLHEDVVDNVFVETVSESSETNITLIGDEEMTHFSVETVDVVTASDDDDHIPRAGSISTSAVAVVSEDESVAVVVEASESFDVVEQSLRDSVLEDEVESVAEVDVVGHDSTTDDQSTHFHNHPHNFHHHHLHYEHPSNGLSLHHHHHQHQHHHQPSLDIAMDQRSTEEDDAARQHQLQQHVEEEGEVESATTTTVVTTEEEAMEQQPSHGIGAVVGDCENSSEDGENDHEPDHDNNNDDNGNAHGDDADDDDEDDDSAFFYPAHRSQRISPFLNTPKQRKEERRKILKLSIHKMRAVEDPEHFLRRSVLINNTMKRLQRELREEKMRNSPRRGCYGLYRRASALHYDVLNNSYLLHDEPFAAVSENDRITDDMTDALVTRLEATTSSPIVVPTPSPSPSPSPSPADEPDTSSAAFPTTSLSLSCSSASPSSSSIATSSSVSPMETSASSLAPCSLDITSTVEESSSATMSAFSEAGPSSSSPSSMSEELVLHSSHHHHHHLQFHHQHHHQQQQQHHHSHDHDHDEPGPVPDLMPSLDDDEVESEVSEALSTTTITSPVTASLSVSDLSSTASSLASSSSSSPPSCSSSNLSSSASSHSMMYEGVFGVPSVVREAQSSGASCSSESQRERQLYADIDTVFNLIRALGDS